MSDELAYRNPNDRRGKAHRRLGPWAVPVCRANSIKGYDLFATLTEVVPLQQTAPEDRCRRCFPPAPHPDPTESPEDAAKVATAAGDEGGA